MLPDDVHTEVRDPHLNWSLGRRLSLIPIQRAQRQRGRRVWYAPMLLASHLGAQAAHQASDGITGHADAFALELPDLVRIVDGKSAG